MTLQIFLLRIHGLGAPACGQSWLGNSLYSYLLLFCKYKMGSLPYAALVGPWTEIRPS